MIRVMRLWKIGGAPSIAFLGISFEIAMQWALKNCHDGRYWIEDERAQCITPEVYADLVYGRKRKS